MIPVVVVTGMSGSGKASILRVLEDLGYDAVDNPPLMMLETLVTRSEKPMAVGLDARSRGFDAAQVLATLDRLRTTRGHRTTLVFATADVPVLLRRFTETRRRHPLAPEGRVADGIEAEAALMVSLRDAADQVIDTSELPLPALRQLVGRQFGQGHASGAGAGMTVTLMSFAFPAGLPREADMVFDARFLRNPHYDPILRPMTGLDPEVAAYVEADPDFEAFFQSIAQLLRLVLPRFVQEGKKYATIAVGCTGGRHRSVRIVERMAPSLAGLAGSGADRLWQVTILHRELTKPTLPATGAAVVPGKV